MKKIMCAVLSAVIALSVVMLGGCVAKGGGEGGSDTLIVWSVPGPLAPGYEGKTTPDSKTTKFIVDKFLETHPGMTVKLIDKGNGTDLHSALQQAYITNQLPDITVGESLIKSQIELKYYEEITINDDIKKNVRSEFFDMSSLGGKNYGVPFTAGVPELLYNETLLKEALDTADHTLFDADGNFIPPTDLDRLLQIAQNVRNYFSEMGRGEIGGILINNVKGLSSAFRGQYFMSLFGGEWFNDSGALDLNTAENIDAFTYMRNMKNASSDGNVAYGTENDCISAFLSGRAAFAIEHPAMLADYAGTYGNIKTAPLPTAGDKESASVLVGTLSYMMTKSCRNKPAALDFLNLLASKEVQQEIYVNSSLRLPVRKDVANELLKSEDEKVLERHKYYESGLRATVTDKLVPGLPYFKTNQYTQIWNDNWTNFINKVFTSPDTISSLLTSLQSDISSKIK